MTKNTIITIGRQFGSGGHEIGELLAKKLGIPFYDRNLVKMAAEELQITEEQEEEYFSHIVDSDVLFCVMYAHWIGLDKGKINCIKKAKTEKTARKRLKESLPIENIYYIDSPEGEVTAYKLEEGILVTESGERYEIV